MIAPTIIIGLGGRGSDICCKVSRLVQNEEQRKRIRFVCIDTDVNDLTQRKKEDSRIITIQTSAPYMVSNYLESNTRARDYWFPNHNILMGKTPTEGAGQVRAISRLAFEEAIREGRLGALEKAIEELFFLDGASSPQAVRVMIVSTLAGGTGSGIVLPVALYTRHFLETRFRKSASIIRGFFLLPEIMFGNKSYEERNSLCCNAYASIRELDAFMRRGDGALAGTQYRDLKIELPDPGSGSYVDYPVSPFNFCFLYDKRNTDDLQLKSFEDYIEHAANTIYAQCVSGMSNRSNSDEDNAIKSLIKSNGRNRFCGAGSSLLQYPRDNVLNYIAGNWCVQQMDEEWVAIDKSYAKYLESQRIIKKKNPGLETMSAGDYYITQIETAKEGTFNNQMLEMSSVTIETKDGLKKRCKSEDYVYALSEHVTQMLLTDPEIIAENAIYSRRHISAENALSKGKGAQDVDDSDDGDTTNEKILALCKASTNYTNKAIQIGNRIGRILSMQIFDDQDHTEEKDAPYRFESYMLDDDQKFIHPNAARYFIYKLQKEFLTGREGAIDQLKKMKPSLNPFDDPSTTHVETAEYFVQTRMPEDRGFFAKFKDKGYQQQMMGAVEEQYDVAIAYARNVALKLIYEAGIDYLGEMTAAYQTFYSNFENYTGDTRYMIAEIARRYVNGQGKATRYVCASARCLKRMLEEMPNPAENADINGPLSAKIYQEIKTFAGMKRRPNPSYYFENLYKDSIMGFWKKQVENNYNSRINMDILEALKAESDYEAEEAQTEEQKVAYAAKIIDEAGRLAAPFIEEPMGDIRHVFMICSYNPRIMGPADSPKRDFVRYHLNERMDGQPDDNVSPYELMIYKAVYNLNAGDLKRFCAPDSRDPNGGVYYAAYMDTIRNLGPYTSKNPVLTPHLDRNWHLTKYMPDLDDRNQKIVEDDIYRALAWGILTGKIEQVSVHDELAADPNETHIVYRPASRRAREFVVSNGTACDELSEVLDALMINPPEVANILEDRKKTIQREKRDVKISFFKSRLISCLNWFDEKKCFGEEYDEDDRQPEEKPNKFVISQFIPGKIPSIFDLIYWFKVSTPVEDFHDGQVNLLVEALVKLIEDHVEQYFGDKKVGVKTYGLLVDQFKLFLENLTDPEIVLPRHRLEDPCVIIIRDQLTERFEEVYQLPEAYCEVLKNLYKTKLSEQEKAEKAKNTATEDEQ